MKHKAALAICAISIVLLVISFVYNGMVNPQAEFAMSQVQILLTIAIIVSGLVGILSGGD